MAKVPTTTESASRDTLSQPVVKQPKPAFDATKAAVRQSVDGSTPLDPFSEAMREATDGDASEGQSLATLGLAKTNGIEGDIVLERARNQSAQSRQPEFDGAQWQDTRQEAEGQSETLSHTTTTRPIKPDVIDFVSERQTRQEGLTRHELLMRLSITMGREQTATFGSEEAAKSVRALMQQSLWARDPHREHNLLLAEMSATIRVS